MQLCGNGKSLSGAFMFNLSDLLAEKGTLGMGDGATAHEPFNMADGRARNDGGTRNTRKTS